MPIRTTKYGDPVTFMHSAKFTGYYRIPKSEPIILDRIHIFHTVNGENKEECDFEIKRQNGEWIIVPDVSKINLNHSMDFVILVPKVLVHATTITTEF